jgi:hypothetical protein
MNGLLNAWGVAHWESKFFSTRLVNCRLSPLTPTVVSPMPAGDAEHKISRRGSLTGILCLIALQLTSVEKTYSVSSIDHYKLYAHSLVVDAKEYRCLELLWQRESNWNYKAKSKTSSARGIPQLLKLKTNDPIEQINLGLKYIKHRHQTPCLAWAYWQRFKHY